MHCLICFTLHPLLILHLLPFSITQLASSCITSSIVFYDFGIQKFPHTVTTNYPEITIQVKREILENLLAKCQWNLTDEILILQRFEREILTQKKYFVLFCDITHWEKSAKSSKISRICFNIRIWFFTKVFQETYFTNDAIYNYWFYRATNVMLLTEHYEQSPLERGLMELI